MPTVLIFGGNGKVARHLTRILTTETEPAYDVHSIIRSPDQLCDLAALGVNPIVQSIEEASVADIVKTLTTTNPDVVVWSAGAGSDDTDEGNARLAAVDRDGAIKVMDACAQGGIKRFITVSALDVRDHSKPVPGWYDEGTKERAAKLWSFIRPFMEAKLAADKELVTGNERRKLDYTIIRPGGLGEAPGTGMVSAGKVQLAKVVKREDLARVIVQCIQDDRTAGLVFDVAAGETPIAEAISRVAEDRIDVFEGTY